MRKAASLEAASRIHEGIVKGVLDRREIDNRGLRPHERAYLAVSVSTLRKVYERYLLRRGLVWMTPFGRVAI